MIRPTYGVLTARSCVSWSQWVRMNSATLHCMLYRTAFHSSSFPCSFFFNFFYYYYYVFFSFFHTMKYAADQPCDIAYIQKSNVTSTMLPYCK